MSYKIKNKETGLYSTGSLSASTKWYSDSRWDEYGKIWHTAASLRKHINNLLRIGGITDNWEIVEIAIREVGQQSMVDFVGPATIMKLLSRTTR